ncbi:IS256 family transposase [Atopobacter sp. AH10]|uniref:IS256 family transposase n=1 Tax=Atopobacter sp. AH10 TaxID=2315861 RepID=UPI000EF2151B|nr:IS256 family transposase [Atopobacter sp. AH10]RLK63042.1 IS256 family transposase [Atopobacter sp. AH10]
MENFNTKIMAALVKGEPIEDIFRQSLEDAVNLLLETERTVFLDYEKWEIKGYNTGNSRNGYYTRSLKTQYGLLNLKIPRDRLGELDIQTVKALQSSQSHLEKMIMMMYQKGVTTSDISELIEKMYGHYYSPATISNLSKSFEEELINYRQREIQSNYVAIYCDATFIPVRRGGLVSKEAVHIILGIDAVGHKEVLDFQLYPNESSVNYREMLQDLKTRGLKKVLLFVSDELNGLAEALTDEFPQALHQTCWTHLLRSVSGKVRSKDRQAIMEALKEVPKSKNIAEASHRLKDFYESWQGIYPKLVEQFKQKRNLFSFMHFPKPIWISLYTNNISENINKQIKRVTKVKEQFPNEKSLEKMVYCYISEYNVKFTQRSHKGFKQVSYELNKLLHQNLPVNEANLKKIEGESQVS